MYSVIFFFLVYFIPVSPVPKTVFIIYWVFNKYLLNEQILQMQFRFWIVGVTEVADWCDNEKAGRFENIMHYVWHGKKERIYLEDEWKSLDMGKNIEEKETKSDWAPERTHGVWATYWTCGWGVQVAVEHGVMSLKLWVSTTLISSLWIIGTIFAAILYIMQPQFKISESSDWAKVCTLYTSDMTWHNNSFQ